MRWFFAFVMAAYAYLVGCQLRDGAKGSDPQAANTPAAASVRVAQGALGGTIDNGVMAFLGVPYAAPPIGPNRWRAPGAPASWAGVRQANHFAPNCWQAPQQAFGPYSAEFLTQGDVNEDCLYLNVWTAAKKGAHLPVMVWVHGGAFLTGSGSGPLTNGAALARQGVIVVTINYRLGVFGFLAHPELTNEAGAAPPANFGVQDQIAALQWVKANIAAFGGDPDNVTVAGQSAGAMSVHYLLGSPLAKGLFIRAIAESGLGDWFPAPDLATAERAGVVFAQSKGAVSIEALRALPADVVGTNNGAPTFFPPVVDGVLISTPPQDEKAAASEAPVPILTGFTADEGGTGVGTDAAAFKKEVSRLYGAFAAQLFEFYSLEDPRDAVRAMHRDRYFAGLYRWQRARRSGGPVYVYLFDHAPPGPQSRLFGAFHSAEIPYVFDTLDAVPSIPFNADDHAIAAKVSNYWLNFLRSGNPNGPELPLWPPFVPQSYEILELGDHFEARQALSAEKKKVFDDYLSHGGSTSPISQ